MSSLGSAAMSELERERHKNASLERARDSWYQEWFKGTERIAALESELLIAKQLNAKWMDERTEAIIRAEKAEADLAAARRTIESMLDFDGTRRERLEKFRATVRHHWMKAMLRALLCAIDEAYRELMHAAAVDHIRSYSSTDADGTEHTGAVYRGQVGQ